MALDWANKIDGVDDVLADDINAIAAAVIENENKIKDKADKATKLEGYGITDAYTKTEVDDALNDKADKQNSNSGFEGGQDASALSGGAIGFLAEASHGGAVGDSASAGWGGAVGCQASAEWGGAVGYHANAADGGAVGYFAKTSEGFAGGNRAETVDADGNAIDAIQLGTGTNRTPKTFQVYGYQMMDADGNIPADRLVNAPKTEVIDNLTSTDTIKALSAAQGKVLNDKKADRDEMLDKLCPHTTISGYPVSITDHLEDESVIDYKIYGNSVQDGTPSSESPVDIVSVGDLVTDTASEYYGKYDVPVYVVGKNLLNTSSGYVTASNNVSSENNFDYANNSFTAKGQVGKDEFASSSGQLWFPLESQTSIKGTDVKAGKTYTLSFEIKLEELGAYNSGFRVIVSNPGGVIVMQKTVYNTKYTFTKIDYNFTAPRTEKICVVIRLNNNKFTVKNIQIEEGPIATSFEPHRTPVTKHIYLDEPLRKKDDYADYIDYKNQKAMRRIEVLDDTGTKSIEESYGTLDTPIEESITIPGLTMPISSITNISTETAISPSNMDVEYYQDINKVISNLTNAILSQGGNV